MVSNAINSIYYKYFVCTKLHVFKYGYLTLAIQQKFLYTVKWSSSSISKDSVQHVNKVRWIKILFLHSTNMPKQKLHLFFNRSSPDNGPKSGRSTRDTHNYGQYMNQFPPNWIKAIRENERIQKKICRQKLSIIFNEICINEEMLPIYICIYIISKQI